MAKYVINEAFLGEVELLQSRLRHNLAGMFGGNHQSRTLGASCEFTDYREYRDGDDISKIDWNAYARFEKLYLKLYLDERQMHTRIYIDASRSMEYGDAKKAETALRFAATAAYISICEMDKVSIYAVKGNELIEVVGGIVGKDAYFASIGRLNDIVFDGDCFLSDAILPSGVGYGDGLSILISDFLTDNDYEAAIDRLVDKKRDAFCLQILAKEELNPQTRGKVHFFDSEDAGKSYRKNIDREIAKAYKLALQYATERLRDYCVSREAGYLLVSAEEDIGSIFFEKMIGTGVLK